MTKNIIILFSVILFSCSIDQKEQESVTDLEIITNLHIELIKAEFCFKQKDAKALQPHLKNVSQLLDTYHEVIDSTKIERISNCKALLKKINTSFSQEQYLLAEHQKIILRNNINTLVLQDRFLPYVVDLWAFEEAMKDATSIAKDPMLDLYEYQEFETFVSCLKKEWYILNLHTPSRMYFNYDLDRSHSERVKFKELTRALNQFLIAVESVDHEKYDLCHHAEELQLRYYSYLKSFVPDNSTRLAVL